MSATLELPHYGCDRVQGDTPRLACDLVAGDVLRAYSGIQDTITVTSVEREMGQGCRYSYTITFSDGTVSNYVEAERRYDLATGGAR